LPPPIFVSRHWQKFSACLDWFPTHGSSKMKQGPDKEEVVALAGLAGLGFHRRGRFAKKMIN
jgi:MYXO-CTERM domain-containing protein